MTSYNSDRFRRSSSLSNRLDKISSSEYASKNYSSSSSSSYMNHYIEHNSRVNYYSKASYSRYRERSESNDFRKRSVSPAHSHRSSFNYDRDEWAIKNSRKYDDPPYSRCFILCSKDTTEQELDRVFQRYGRIQDIWVVKDHQTKFGKGIAYIKYSKASEAARAVEEMSGKYLNDRHQRPVKVFISGCRNQIDRSQPKGEIYDKMLRLVVTVNKKFTKLDLKNAFSKYGIITNCQIVYDQNLKENKGFGYVTFLKASEAARAMEEASKSFCAKFARLNNNVQYNDNSNSSNHQSVRNNKLYKNDSEIAEDDDTNSVNNYSLIDNQNSMLIDEEDEILEDNNKIEEENKKIPPENVCIQIENRKQSNNLNGSIGNVMNSSLLEQNSLTQNGSCVINGLISSSSSLTSLKALSQIDLSNNENNFTKINDLNNDSCSKSDRKILIIDDRNNKNIKIKLNQNESNNLLSNNSVMCSNSIIKDKSILNQGVKSPILLVKTKVSDVFLRQLFDLVPGLVEFGNYVSGCFQITNQYLVRYENDILSAYVVKKFNDLILPSGDRIIVEYLNEEFIRNFFLLNSATINSNINTFYNNNNNNNNGKSIQKIYNETDLNNNLTDIKSDQKLTTFFTNTTNLKQIDSIELKSNFISDLKTNNLKGINENNILEINSNNQDINYSSYSDSLHTTTTVMVNCRHEITKELFHLIMSQFNNLIDVHLNFDKLSGYADFSNELDALLAINTINEREIANNYFTAKIDRTKNNTNCLTSNKNGINKFDKDVNGNDISGLNSQQNNINKKKNDCGLIKTISKNENNINNIKEDNDLNLNNGSNILNNQQRQLNNMNYKENETEYNSNHNKKKKMCIRNF